MQNTPGHLKVTEVDAPSAGPLPYFRVDRGDVIIRGPFYIYGNDVEIMRAGSVDNVGIYYILKKLPSLHYVQVGNSEQATFRLRCGAPTVIWLEAASEVLQVDGISRPNEFLLPVSMSVGLNLSAGSYGGSTGNADPNEPWLSAQPMLALPGAFIGSGTKAAAAAAGAQVLFNLAAPQPVYCVFSALWPQPGPPVAGPLLSPIYLWWRTTAGSKSTRLTTFTEFKAGDLTGFFFPGNVFNVDIAIDDLVSDVGLWIPDADQGGSVFLNCTVAVYGLKNQKVTPVSGGGRGGPRGLTTGGLGGTAAGAGASGGGGGGSVALASTA